MFVWDGETEICRERNENENKKEKQEEGGVNDEGGRKVEKIMWLIRHSHLFTKENASPILLLSTF